MISRLHGTALLFVSFVIGGVLLAIDGVDVQLGWLSVIGGTVSGMSLVLLAFQHWIWTWPWLQDWFVQRPDLQGTWRVRIDSSWVGEDGASPETIDAYLVIRQTYSTLSLRMLTPESSSEMVGCSIERADDGVYRIAGTYQNRPRISLRDRSPIHFGAIALDVQGKPPTALEGHYWTDRLTRGELVATERKEMKMHSYAEAFDAFRSQGANETPHSVAA